MISDIRVNHQLESHYTHITKFILCKTLNNHGKPLSGVLCPANGLTRIAHCLLQYICIFVVNHLPLTRWKWPQLDQQALLSTSGLEQQSDVRPFTDYRVCSVINEKSACNELHLVGYTSMAGRCHVFFKKAKATTHIPNHTKVIISCSFHISILCPRLWHSIFYHPIFSNIKPVFRVNLTIARIVLITYKNDFSDHSNQRFTTTITIMTAESMASIWSL